MLEKFTDFMKKTFSGDGGFASFSRVGTGIIVFVVLTDMTYLVIKTGKFPDASQIIALCAFNTSLYLSGKKFEADKAIADINRLKPILPDTNTTTANVIVQPATPVPQAVTQTTT